LFTRYPPLVPGGRALSPPALLSFTPAPAPPLIYPPLAYVASSPGNACILCSHPLVLLASSCFRLFKHAYMPPVATCCLPAGHWSSPSPPISLPILAMASVTCCCGVSVLPARLPPPSVRRFHHLRHLLCSAKVSLVCCLFTLSDPVTVTRSPLSFGSCISSPLACRCPAFLLLCSLHPVLRLRPRYVGYLWRVPHCRLLLH
jgi:hypothetical protein